MSNREFLQLAKNYEPNKYGIGGWYLSEKLDGMRAYWDGGISRGKLCNTIPFANTEKDYRLVEQPIATGLWSRYGKPIHAPDWFLDQLPNIPLDGELYLDIGKFQELISIVKQHKPDERWLSVSYLIFDAPGDQMMFSPGKINNPNFKLLMPDIRDDLDRDAPSLPFYRVLDRLHKYVAETNHIHIHKQKRLPIGTHRAQIIVDDLLEFVTDKGGEGLILRKPESVWTPKRTNELLKVKKLLDSEAIVTGYTWGKGKLEGLMGALIVCWHNGQAFELSGFTDAERKMTSDWGEPGSIVLDNNIINPLFPIGSKVTFRYTEVSNDGVPLKARYLRKAQMS